MAQVKRSFDVLVVGSGASGGWACKRLAEAGLKVGLLEAGRPQSDSNFTEHKPPYELKYWNLARQLVRKTRPIQSEFACDEYNYKWFCNDFEEPYTTPPGKPFQWLGRLRITGGRTNVWGRISLRFSDFDLKPSSHDGFGENWPLAYEDLEPYYDLVERYVGISGLAEGLEQLPDSRFLPPMALTCQEVLLRNRAKQKLGWSVIPPRIANLTQPLNGRAACHYCGPCERGCITRSYFNSAFTTVADALKTENCTLISNAMVHKVLMNNQRNRVRGLLYVDRNTLETREVLGKVVILCAQTQESTRILLNSANREYPNGLANSSGVLGHYFTSHVRSGGGSGELPTYGTAASLDGPNRPAGFYVARFRNLKNGPQSKNFLRGYGFVGDSGVDFNWSAPGYGKDFKRALLEPHAFVSVTGFGEVLPRWDNFLEIDPQVVDRYGIPVLRIHMSNSTNETEMIKDMAVAAGELLEAAGATNIRTRADIASPRWAVHEGGTARMGTDAKTSVLNQFQQSHDIKNLFVMDACGFRSNPCQNPTLTIMALCVRSCEYLMGEMKRGNL
jgi:choline dehydrogenase-like flavoprotein